MAKVPNGIETLPKMSIVRITVSAIYLALWLLFTLCMSEPHYSVNFNKLNDDDDYDGSTSKHCDTRYSRNQRIFDIPACMTRLSDDDKGY